MSERNQLEQIRAWVAGDLYPDHDTFSMSRGFAAKLLEIIDAESDEYDQLITVQSNLLRGVANALKGDPGPLKLHDQSDLPAVAAALMAKLET